MSKSSNKSGKKVTESHFENLTVSVLSFSTLLEVVVTSFQILVGFNIKFLVFVQYSITFTSKKDCKPLHSVGNDVLHNVFWQLGLEF